MSQAAAAITRESLDGQAGRLRVCDTADYKSALLLGPCHTCSNTSRVKIEMLALDSNSSSRAGPCMVDCEIHQHLRMEKALEEIVALTFNHNEFYE
jgi:hypothetical protein